MTAKVRMLVWSDYVCPFCYLEVPVLERLQAEMNGTVEVEWRAFELRPEPAPTLDPDGQYLHRVWNASVYPMAAERGLDLRLPPVQPRSRRALEAAEFARAAGLFDPMHRALFAAFFQEGRDLADTEVLLDVAAAAGLDRDELRAALDAGVHTPKVLADERLAQQLGVSGVPAILLRAGDRNYLLGGAQPYDVVREAVEQVTAELQAADN